MKDEIEKYLQKAYKAQYDNNYWNQITKLRKFVNEEMILKCFLLINSEDLKLKQIGLDILCQLGQNRKDFVKKLIQEIFIILKKFNDEKLISACLFALSHNSEYLKIKHIKTLQKFQSSKSKHIRYALTFCLCGIENDIAINTLIKLAKDRSPQVKDWATFGLGTQITIDNEDIRNILYKNCFSKDDQTKQEAIKGLANRNDERVKNIILQELKDGNFGSLFFDTILNIKNGEEYISYLIEIYNRFKNDENINKEWLSNLKNCIEVLQSE